jgi:hypothetical protein
MFYQVVLRQLYAGQRCINTWNYYTGDTVTSHLGAFSLASALGFIEDGDPLAYPSGAMFAHLFGLCSNLCTFTDAMVQAMYDPLDFYEQPFNPPVHGGDSGGNGLSPTQAYGFQTQRVRLDISRGHKRFVGVTENRTDDGGVINSSQITLLNALGTIMGATLTDSSSGAPISFKPVILGKLKYTTPSGKTAYKKYATEALQAEHMAENLIWSPYENTRTQNTRQYGRGV